MNTPAHMVVNCLLLGRRREAAALVPIVLGGAVPDLPIYLFYFVQKIVLDRPEASIWSHDYYQRGWQDFFDLFNSLPLFALLFLLAYRRGRRGWALFFASMALHALGDLPLHHDDGHRHFFPLSDWRFVSPVSYWDPRHYGWLVVPIEAAATVGGAVLLARRHRARWVRVLAAALIACYAAGFAYALVVWV